MPHYSRIAKYGPSLQSPNSAVILKRRDQLLKLRYTVPIALAPPPRRRSLRPEKSIINNLLQKETTVGRVRKCNVAESAVNFRPGIMGPNKNNRKLFGARRSDEIFKIGSLHAVLRANFLERRGRGARVVGEKRDPRKPSLHRIKAMSKRTILVDNSFFRSHIKFFFRKSAILKKTY